jgi:hypothetical protein
MRSLRIMFPIVAKRDAMAWIYEYRVDWDSPVAPRLRRFS